MIVVTGGAGFIGSNLVAALGERGEREVVVCDRLGGDDKWRNLAKHEIAELVAPEGLHDFLDRHGDAVETVFHLGAVSSTTETDADLVMSVNFTFSLALWRWCAAHRARLIYASSAATYGDGAQGFDDDAAPEALARLRPLNLYGWSKHLFDRRVVRWAADGAPRPPQWAGLKFFNVYGPNEYHKGAMRSVVVQVWERAARGEPVRLFRSHHPDYADGGQMRDFVAVADCVSVMLWLYDNPQTNGLFNLGTGTARSFADLAQAVYAALGAEPEIVYIDTPAKIRGKYQYFTRAETARLRAAGYGAPFVALEDGVADYVHNFLGRPDPYR
ncbi:MAG: ADP-glyceromanno-heptose 6-epimerase [Alphaproteobacteria bacterium]